MVVSISLKTYYSVQHVQAAAYFANEATELERKSTLDPGSRAELLVACKGCVSATLFTSVAFLEALASELFADAAQSGGGHLAALEKDSSLFVEVVARVPVLTVRQRRDA